MFRQCDILHLMYVHLYSKLVFCILYSYTVKYSLKLINLSSSQDPLKCLLVFTHPPPPPPTQTFFLAKLAGLGLNRSDGPIWVGMTQVGSEEVRTSRWTPRMRSSGTTGGTSGSTSMSLKLSDSFMRS